MGEVSKVSSQDSCGRRVSSRLDLRLAARFITLDETIECILLDVSLTGARVRLQNSTAASRDALLVVLA